MTEVIVTESNNTVVVDTKTPTVIVTGMMPPSTVSSITNSVDVDLQQLQDGGVLVYNSTTQKWSATNLLDRQIIESGQF
jgi:hypothetical protein